jgi:hypothetical protein
MVTLRKATKSKAKLRLGLAGTSGSGKTYSALIMASGMTPWNKVCIIDTENGSADLYSKLGEYNVITLTAPFSPEHYMEAIKVAEDADMEVIIIDSITHEWDGAGGILQIHEQMGGNSFTAWGKLTPRHNAFIQAILQSPAHIITTVRRKQDYSMETVDGKTKVMKQGLKEITREGFEYELTLSFSLAQNHLATASKDRTGLFMDKPEFVVSKETGKQLKKWANDGAKVVEVKEEIKTVPVEESVEEEPVVDQQVPLIAPKEQPKTVEDDHYCHLHNKPLKSRSRGIWDHRNKGRLDGENFKTDEKGDWYWCQGKGYHLSINQ